jgi:hypothetical protein
LTVRQAAQPTAVVAPEHLLMILAVLHA